MKRKLGKLETQHADFLAFTLSIGRTSQTTESQFHSPIWHTKALRQTERLVKAGKAKFSDWAVARERIRRKAGKLAGKFGSSI